MKMIICDEELIFVKLLKQELDRCGHEVLTASDGLGCLDLIGREKPQLLITDLFVPRINGLELIARAREACKDISILVYADVRSEKVIDQVFRLGVKDFITKPFDPDRLLWRIKSIANRLNI